MTKNWLKHKKEGLTEISARWTDNDPADNKGITIKRVVFGVIIIACLMLVTYQFWLFPADTVPSPSRDFNGNLIPFAVYRAQILSGQSPFQSLWYSGESSLLNPIWSFFYLPSTLLFLALSVVNAVRVVTLLHLVLGWMTMWLLAREFTKHPAAPVFAAFLYVFSGTWAARLLSYHFHLYFGLALMPLVFWSFKRLMDRPTVKGALLLGCLLAVMVYAGAMYLTPFTGVALAFASVTLLILQKGDRRSRTQMLVLAMMIFFLAAAPKLIPNLMQGLAASRPPAFSASWYDVLAAFMMPGDIWPLTMPQQFAWRWNEVTNYISVAGLLLAGLGWWALLKSKQRLWAWAFLAVMIVMVYWSLGFPPFGLPSILSSLRVTSRTLMLVALLACVLAGVGLDALLTKQLKVPKWLWVVLVIGLIFEITVILIRAHPGLSITEYLPLFGRTLSGHDADIFDLLLWLAPWQALRGLGIALGVLVLLLLALRLSRSQFAVQPLLLAGVALVLTATVMSANPVGLAADPFQNSSLLSLREQISGSTVALAANINEKDKRGLIELFLAGQVHLLNPIYGSFGQDVSEDWLLQMDYVLSSHILVYDVSLWRHWSPGGVLAVVPNCKLSLVGEFTAEDPITRDDLSEFTSKHDIISATSSSFPLYLYHVDHDACPDRIQLQN
ncbi:MAG: YfhO family protein [Proteobacteria bacterium]|nr:YfhO family protein [Pseudomonadota bacterium]